MSFGPISSSAASASANVGVAIQPRPAQVSAPSARDIDAAKQAAAVAAKAAPKGDQLDKAIESINRFLQPIASSIEFSIDQDSGRTLVKVVDNDTKDVLRQFPSKDALAISRELGKLQGLLMREKA